MTTIEQQLCEFLAWVQDNYTEVADDCFLDINDTGSGYQTREQIVNRYLTETGGTNGQL